MGIPGIIRDACGTYKGKKIDATFPFVRDGYVYATDGRIMVRCVAYPDEIDPRWERSNVPDVGPIINQAADVERRVTLALPECERWLPCDRCAETGIIKGGDFQCDVCGEDHKITLHGDPISWDCMECDGKGKLPNDADILVRQEPRRWLGGRYVGLLRAHGVTEIDAPVDDDFPSGDGRACWTFKGPGFEGWLMPLDHKQVEARHERERATSGREAS